LMPENAKSIIKINRFFKLKAFINLGLDLKAER